MFYRPLLFPQPRTWAGDLPSCQKAIRKITRFKQTMNDRMNPTETDPNADRARAWAAALSDEQVADQTPTSLWENDRTNYGTDTDVMIPITIYKIEDSIAEELDCVYVKRIETEIHIRNKETIIELLQLGNHVHQTESKWPSPGSWKQWWSRYSAVGLLTTSCHSAPHDACNRIGSRTMLWSRWYTINCSHDPCLGSSNNTWTQTSTDVAWCRISL